MYFSIAYHIFTISRMAVKAGKYFKLLIHSKKNLIDTSKNDIGIYRKSRRSSPENYFTVIKHAQT
ncbi:MAG: hypothetical protein HQM10_26705 [Candidatus Riflebacteria bacterium]|nr:hypothetical protein [Candidatus Riflebacteria bacterium]